MNTKRGMALFFGLVLFVQEGQACGGLGAGGRCGPIGKQYSFRDDRNNCGMGCCDRQGFGRRGFNKFPCEVMKLRRSQQLLAKLMLDINRHLDDVDMLILKQRLFSRGPLRPPLLFERSRLRVNLDQLRVELEADPQLNGALLRRLDVVAKGFLNYRRSCQGGFCDFRCQGKKDKPLGSFMPQGMGPGVGGPNCDDSDLGRDDAGSFGPGAVSPRPECDFFQLDFGQDDSRFK